jgi:hypothetical protein
MILVRVTFQAAYGKAGEIVEILKRDMPMDEEGGRGRILTDLSGAFDTVVLENEIESIDDYFTRLREMFAEENANESESMRKVAEMIESGHREFFTIEAET